MIPRGPLHWGPRPINAGRLRKLTKDPEVINRKVYWHFEHSYTRRTVLNACQSGKYTRLFGMLLDPETVHGYGVSHELSLPGPFTGFIPVDVCMKELSKSLSEADPEKLVEFVRSHFTRDLWLHRDITGSPTQPWLVFNAPRASPESLLSLSGQQLSVESGGDIRLKQDYTKINGARVLRWNLRCHNGVIHLVDRPLVALAE